MAQYLTKEEIATYCTAQAGVEESDVIIASELIDGYIGRGFSETEHSETVVVNERSRGKLNCYPVISIVSAKELSITPLGINKINVDVNSIVLDAENDGYFYYIGKPNPFACMSMYDCCNTRRKKKLEVTYKYGFESVPDDIKIVTAMLAQNIRQFSSFAGIKKLDTLDYTVEMANPSFFTNDMRVILDKYR